jgi:hypothetical protein
MTAWIALLRAVNVGGTGKLAMSELKAMCGDGMASSKLSDRQKAPATPGLLSQEARSWSCQYLATTGPPQLNFQTSEVVMVCTVGVVCCPKPTPAAGPSSGRSFAL